MNKRIRNIVIYRILPGVLLGGILYSASIYYEQRQELEEYNLFLETSAAVSETHYLASEAFIQVLDFDLISREVFESKISDIVNDAQKGYDLLFYAELPSLNIKKKSC